VSEGILDHGNARHLVSLFIFIEAHVVCGTTADGGELVVTLVVTIVVLSTLLIVVSDGSEDFDLTTENHGEAFSANRFFDKRETRAGPPFVEFTTESISFNFQTAEFARSKLSMSARGVDVSDGGINNRRLGRASDLRQIGEESRKIQESSV